jgi:A/G-specific adenine glycosylase
MLEEIAAPLLEWYRKNKRILPWRETGNPYQIWVSEIMLQQTRVEAVKPYFLRFTEALPTVHDLAVCPEERLLKLWEGLGYYNRVRNMQKAAVLLEERFHGRFPADREELIKLPGIGSYTAGAIGSIAFGLPIPAVDGNVLRVLSRLREDPEDISRQSVRRRMEEELAAVMPEEAPGEFNQALMELGAVVCVPKGRPGCESCPLEKLCRAHRHGMEEVFPVKAAKKKRRVEERTVLIIQDGERVAFQKRPAHGLLAGMYEFPCLQGKATREEALEWIREKGFVPLHIRQLEQAGHIFSHVEWKMSGFAVRIASFEGSRADGLILADVETAEKEYSLPSAYRAYAGCISLKQGNKEYHQQRGRK